MKNRLNATLSGIISGVFIGIGAFLFSIVVSLPFFDKTFLRIIGSIVFPIGLILICLLKTFLYTGKIGFVFESNKDERINLIFIFLGNVVGIGLLGILLRLFCNLISYTDVISTVTNLANNRVVDIFTLPQNLIFTFFNGIFCGVFVFLAVFSFKQKFPLAVRIILVIINIGLFVFLGFEHCIANVFYFAFANTFSISVVLNVLVVTIANSLGSLCVYFIIKLIKHLVD